MATLPSLSFVSFALLAASPLAAQCGVQLLPGQGVAGAGDLVACSTMWDPDGAGPQPQRLVIGGNFTVVGAALCNRIAMQDPVSGLFAPLGTGMNGPVQALAVMQNGDLIAAGQFATAGGVAAMWLARWNGVTWAAMLGPFHYYSVNASWGVHALAVLPNGDLVIGGEFYEPVTGAFSLLRWDGNVWSPLGAGISGATWTVNALAVLQNGDLAVAGAFTTAGSTAAANIARWDGANWFAFGSGTDGTVKTLATTAGGDVLAGGAFTSAGGAPAAAIARWSIGSWTGFGSGLSGGASGPFVASIAVLGSGDVVAGGGFTTAGGLACANVARWNGAWSPLGAGAGSAADSVRTLTGLPTGEVFAGGAFLAAGGATATNCALWNGAAWLPFAVGGDGRVLCLRTLGNGDLLAAGQFTAIAGTAASRVARWNGTAWSPLGVGTDGVILTALELPNGDIVVGGQFANAGGVLANNIARWNGSTWSPLGAGMSGTPGAWVQALALLPNGDIVAGGRFTTAGIATANHIARWDGATWSPLGSGVAASFLQLAQVTALATLANGHLVAGGTFQQAGGIPANRVARWDGAAWSAMGTGWANGSTSAGSNVTSLLRLPNGDLLAGGTVAGFLSAGPLAQRWDGSSWTTLPGLVGALGANDTSATVSAMTRLPDGDVLVGGRSLLPAGGGAADALLRWDGSVWSTMVGTGSFDDAVTAVDVDGSGVVRAGGYFRSVAGNVSLYFAEFAPTCPASAPGSGAGCSGSAGLNALATTSLPWLGSLWSTRATGMPANAIVCRVLGFTNVSLPLAAILPQGGAGCTLLVSPDFVDLHLPVNGVVVTSLAIPDVMALVGLAVHAQVTPIELDSLGNIIGYTASNALSATIGAL